MLAMTVGLMTHRFAQPNVNAHALPKPSRMNTYSPPVLGWRTASSVNTSEPQMDRMPPTIHARITGVNPGSSCATECGERKMPEPMMLPTVIAVAA